MKKINDKKILPEVASYYSEKIGKYGETPQGVDWNGALSQNLRFQQLCKVIRDPEAFSLNDLGCGYGALLGFLEDKYQDITYLGVDISVEMIKAATLRYQDRLQTRFIVASEPDTSAQYGVASGIFNVRLGYSDSEWLDYIEATLNVMDKTSSLGFAFNCLTSYSDEEKKRDYLYYADPCRIFDLCKRRYSKNVALLHDYGLYEFTILIRKS